MTKPSSDVAAITGYTLKRDFRRYLDQEMRREGHDYFWPNTTLPIGLQPFPTTDEITLIHEAKRPNGQRGVVAGTPTTLYRYFGLDNGAYFEGNGTPAAYFEEPPSPNTPYFDDNPGSWIIIDSGLASVAQRWEELSINGWSIFNNGVDLPQTYRVEDLRAKPLYELRESGIAAVGTIAEFFGILMAADISEIQAEKLDELFDPIGVRRSGAMTAKQAGNTVSTPDDFFAASDFGRTIIFDDGTAVDITAFVDARTVTVGGAAQIVNPQVFKLRTKASQVGATYSGLITATQFFGGFAVVASAAYFNVGMIGKHLRYINGWEAVITGVSDPTHLTVDKAAPGYFPNLPFYITSGPGSVDYEVTASADIFDAGMVGHDLLFDDGTVRRIESFIDSKHVTVDSDSVIVSQLVGIDNPASYAAYTKKEFINRIGYRVIWSMNDLPTRFAPLYRGSIVAGTRTLRLSNPAKSLEIGQTLLIEGAGVDGGNLTATIRYVAGGRIIQLDTAADTDVVNGNVSKADALNSIVGFEDLQDDSSAILRMLELAGNLVIYKETAIAICRYTGDVAAPFVFRLKRIPVNHALFYRNTLIMVNSQYHLYAGRDSFFEFDLVNLYPRVSVPLELCKDFFFNVATLAQTHRIWAADNVLTSEIWFVVYPQEIEDRLLAYDYLSPVPTVSTSSARISAAATIKRPASGATVGENEDWFVMGTAAGAVLIYGLTYLPNPTWGGAKAIFYRREAAPYIATKLDYICKAQSGLSGFGSAHREKDVRAWVPLLASQSPETALQFELLGARNVEEGMAVLATQAIVPPKTLVSLFFRRNYFGHRITVSGIDKEFRLEGWIYEISGVNSKSFVRRP